MNNKKYLNRLFNSDKPLIIYKEKKGFNIYTDFSSKINVNKSNIKQFLQKVKSSGKKKNNFFDGYIGFFGYETCCKLINIKIHSLCFLKCFRVLLNEFGNFCPIR